MRPAASSKLRILRHTFGATGLVTRAAGITEQVRNGIGRRAGSGVDLQVGDPWLMD